MRGWAAPACTSLSMSSEGRGWACRGHLCQPNERNRTEAHQLANTRGWAARRHQRLARGWSCRVICVNQTMTLKTATLARSSCEGVGLFLHQAIIVVSNEMY